MGRVARLVVSRYRSILQPVSVEFPENIPVILIGENNAGKSNLIRAIDLLLGETWPGTHEPEDHEYHGRDKANSPIEIVVDVEDVWRDQQGTRQQILAFVWRYPDAEGQPFKMVPSGQRETHYVRKDIREQCISVVVGAHRRLSYQLSYSTKYTLMSKLMKQFHQALTADPARVDLLKSRFEEIESTFKEVQQYSTFARELQAQVDDFSTNLEYGLSVDFSAYDPSNYFHALRVFPEQGGETRTFDELGTGQEQVLALAFAYAYAKAFHGEGSGLVLVVEEPEAHLHPLAQLWLGRRVHQMAADELQIVLSTHSPAFVDLANLEGLVLVRREGGMTKTTQLTRDELATYCREHGAAAATAESVLPFYSAAATNDILAGLFARKVVLVEGPSEAMALPVYLERTSYNVTAEGCAIIAVHGVGNLAKWWRFFTAYGIPTYVVFDNDQREDDDGRRRLDVLTALGVPDSEHREAIESVDWIVKDSYMVFGRNYEDTMRRYMGESYSRLEQEAREKFRLSAEQSKPLIARYVAQKIEDQGEAGWERIRYLRNELSRLGAEG